MAAKMTPTPASNINRDLAHLADVRGPMTEAERAEQFRNAVHGNLGLEFPSLTHADVDAALRRTGR
jgi:hypothetical protein